MNQISLLAQFSVGLNVGPSISNMRIDGLNNLIQNPDPYTGIRMGASFQYYPIESFAFETGLNYHRTGFIASEGIDFEIFNIDVPANLKAITSLHFLEFPLLASYHFGNDKIRAYIEAGPQLSFASDGEVKTRATLLIDFTLGTYDINMRNSNFRQFEWSSILGTGLEWSIAPKVNMNLGVQYLHGFTDLTSEPILDIRTRRSALSSTLGVQYKF